MSEQARMGLKRRVFEVLEVADPNDRVSQFFDWFILSLILANILALVCESMEEIHWRYEAAFFWFEVVSVAIFTLEYILRVWSCQASPLYSQPIRGRLRFAFTPMALIDLIAVLPFYAYVLAIPSGFDLRFIRAARMLRLAKLGRYSPAMQMLGRVARRSREELFATVGLMFMLLFFASALIYYAEHKAQPDYFSSIPASAWWAVCTLTTVGYGDVVPITPLGRFLAAIIAMLGISMFALPTGIIGARYVEEIQRRKAVQACQSESIVCPHCGREINEHSGVEEHPDNPGLAPEGSPDK